MKDQTQTAEWYSTPFIVTHLKKYFFEKRFRVVQEDQPVDNSVIIFSRLLSKERVEIKGVFPENVVPELKQIDLEHNNGVMEIMRYVLDIALSPFSFLSSEEEKSICLPGLAEYEEVVERLRDYFIPNHLELKVYFVNQDGSVKFVHLKQNRDQILSGLEMPH